MHMLLSQKQFQISQLRADKTIMALESIAVMLLAVLVTVFLPNIVYTYFYANQELTAEPPIMKLIPTVSFAVAAVFFVFANGGNIMRMMKIKKLEKELASEMMECCSDGCHCGHDHMEEDDMDEMEEVAPKKSKSSKK